MKPKRLKRMSYSTAKPKKGLPIKNLKSSQRYLANYGSIKSIKQKIRQLNNTGNFYVLTPKSHAKSNRNNIS